MEKVMSKMGRFIAPLLVFLTLTLSYVLLPGERALAQQWVNGFLRAADGSLEVTCNAGCGVGTLASPSYVVGTNTNNSLAVTNNGTSLNVACTSGCGAAPPWVYTNTTDTVAHTLKSSAGTFAGVANLATSSQTAGMTCTWYDSITATGTVLYQVTVMPAGQVISFGAGAGIKTNNGLTVQCSGGTPVSPGVQTLWL